MPIAVIGVLAIGGAAAWLARGAMHDAPPPRLEIELSSTTRGTMQVFFDRGGGVTPATSTSTPLYASEQPRLYALPLPLGSIKLLRIDPSDHPGTWLIAAARVRDGAGRSVVEIPLDQLQPHAQTTATTLTATGLVVNAIGDTNDPQLLYTPQPALRLQPATLETGTVVRTCVGVIGLGLLLMALERLTTLAAFLGRCAGWGRRRPYHAVVAGGVIGALVATYPLLVGYSLVSPNNGGTLMLYEQAPFVPGSSDLDIEDTRGTDVGAMMWAILPYTVVQREALAAGEAPLWNRYNGIGEPLWGQGQTYALDPIHWLSLLIPEPALAMDVRFVAARAIFAVGAGLTVLVATGSWSAGVLIALLAPFVGHFVYRLNHPAYFSIVYAPWVLVAYGWLAAATSTPGRARAAVWLTAAAALQMVGSTPKEGLVALLCVHVCGVIGAATTRGTWSERASRLDWACLAGVTMALLTAPHWLVFLGTLARSYTLYDTPAVHFARWPHLASYVLGGANPDMASTGVHPALAALGLVGALHLRGAGAMARGALAGIVVFAGIACGGVPAEVLMRLPLISNIHQIDNAFLAATIPPLLLLAGAGAARLFNTAAPRRPWLTMALVVLLAAVGLQALPGVPHDLATLILVGSVVGGLGVMVVAASGTPQTAVTAVVALTLAGGASAIAGGLHVLHTGIPVADHVLMQPRPRANLVAPSPLLAAMQARSPEPFRAAPVESTLFPGTQVYWGIEGIGGPDAIRLPEVEVLLDAAFVERTTWGWRSILHGQDLDKARGLLDMLNVRYLIRSAPLLPLPNVDAEPLRVEERPAAWPRAFFVDGVERHHGVLAFSSRLAEAVAPFASVDDIDGDALAAVQLLPTAATTVVPASNYRLTPNTSSFVVHATGPGMAVLSEAYVAGDFEATLNGGHSPYVRVNHALKGIVIPAAGVWTIRFAYVPGSWVASWTLATVGALGLLALAWCGYRRQVEMRCP